MTDTRFTEERLKYWLDTNQVQRERLCISLLPLLGDFTDVKPRRPKGGPDGARDLEAVYKKNNLLWGAVGFQNGANDSSDQKRWIREKFKSDIESAKKENENLKYFVFFTNVDLTPSEQTALHDYGYTLGFEYIEIFYRERLRQVLDTPQGFGFRKIYLDISMSDEEQVSFIENIQKNRSSELDEIKKQQLLSDKKIERLEFLSELNRNFISIYFLLKLNKKYTPDELKHFRAVFQIKKIYKSDMDPIPDILIGGRDAYFQNEKNIKLMGIKHLIWQTIDQHIITNRVDTLKETSTDEIVFTGYVYNDTCFKEIGEFDRTSYDIFLSDNLLDKIEMIGLVVNNFRLFIIDRKGIATAEEVGLVENSPPIFPEFLSDDEKQMQWKRVYLRNENTDNTNLFPPDRHNSREFHFSEYTPKKVNIPAPLMAGFYEKCNLVIR